MKTFWKVLITFAVLGIFVLVIAFVLAAIMSGADMSSLGSGGQVSVIPIYGTITLGGCPGGLFSSGSCAEVDTIKRQLKEAEDDSSVKAIVLDIYSGGGNVVASRELMRAVQKTKQKKPVVAWIGEIGASGAYYVASATDWIVADENSMTGSIGVIMFVQHYYELMNKIGVNVTVIKAGDSKDIASSFRPMEDYEKKELETMIDKVYNSFVTDVAKNRKLDKGYVMNISQGRIYLGIDAYENGLVDELGGFDAAVDAAARLGKIKGEPGIKRVEKELSLADLLS